ncbi:hypothetical protein RB595_005312 [Gaeumannomyces hyphopodioides]
MDRPSSSASADSHHVPATGKGSKPRQSTHGSPTTTRNEISVKTRGAPSEPASSKRSTRGNRKRYVESESDEEEEDEEQDVIRVGSARDADGDADADDDEEMEDMGDEDADGDPDDMDIDAEGEEDDEDAEGEPDDDVGESIVVTKPPIRDTRSRAPASRKPAAPPSRKLPARKVAAAAAAAAAANDDDDDELSELDSDVGDPNDETMLTMGDGLGDEDADGDPDDDVDAEGEEIEVATKAADDDDEGEDDDDDDDELGSDAGSREETPDFTKMTKRQRARFEDEPQEYMKLSDEVQVKKVFTAEELSMRRSEMARRRRNLSDKRNEEVKMETINKLLKKQPSKASRRAAAAAENEGEDGEGGPRANPLFVRWVSNKDGCHVSVPIEIVEGPVGHIFAAGTGRKMVQEV